MRVNRHWRDLVCNTLDLWKQIELSGSIRRKKVDLLRELPRLIRHSRQGRDFTVMELSIYDDLATLFNCSVLTGILTTCPSLTRLLVAERSSSFRGEAKAGGRNTEWEKPSKIRAPLEVFHLELTDCDIDDMRQIRDALVDVHATLRDLSIIGPSFYVIDNDALHTGECQLDHVTDLELVCRDSWRGASIPINIVSCSMLGPQTMLLTAESD
jgi:hypothetical protein